jgi:hypothetical protein
VTTAAVAARRSPPAAVLIVAGPGDRHADTVAGELARRGVSVARTSLDRLRTTALAWQPGAPLLLAGPTATVTVDAGTTAWWRRPGRMATGDLDPDQAALAQAEGAAILQGSLRATVGRWVDPPSLVDAAEDKLYQLHLAHALGVTIPDTLVTSDPAAARAFAARSVLAKPVSAGSGIAPFAGRVSVDQLELVVACPVLLQRQVPASADLRVVPVGTAAFAWSRPRSSTEPLDWRLADPPGRGFRLCPAEELAAPALRIADALGLTFTVQDWLASPDGPVFLEVNPQGQWLFLDGADRRVAPALAAHLLGR